MNNDPDVPGSRPRVVHDASRTTQQSEASWDRNPKIYFLDGRDVEMFLIGSVAEALERKVVTMYSWERRGWLPLAVFRAPITPGLRTPLASKREGARLYTRQLIQGYAKIAQEEGLLHIPGLSPGATKFPDRAFAWCERVGG